MQVIASAQDFEQSIKPVLQQNCAGCHNPSGKGQRIDFLAAESAKDVEARRGLWSGVAAQLRNRTMPPVASDLSEDDRLRIATWLENRLRETACSTGDYAGAVAPRRLNRREYHQTIRDLLGVDLAVADIFPADESGGAGFDTNGETLFIPPMLLERYLEAAQKVLDRVIVTPPLSRTFPSAEMHPPLPSSRPDRSLEAGQEVSIDIPISVESAYSLRVSVERPKETPFEVEVKIDGVSAGVMPFAGVDRNGGPTARAQVANLERGVHKVAVVAGKLPILLYSLTVEQRQPPAPPDKAALHHRLVGLEPGESPIDPREAARKALARFLPKAYRHPVDGGEVDRFLALYDRAALRGDPFEESLKLALKAVLISSPFLFRLETRTNEPGVRPLGQYDLASRLSYMLWSTMPDDELMRLAAEGRLQDPGVLAAQVDRMLEDPRARAFASAFVGQWLGTQDIGGRAVPLLTELQHYYTPEVAAELRQEPVMLFGYLVSRNRSLLELLTADYSFLTARLAKFYQVEDRIELNGDAFQLVKWPDNRRAGVLGMASVLAMNSHYRQSSPVLRGAWVLDTLLGTPVPPPPPDVPPLEKAAKSEAGLSTKQILDRHGSDASCAACHKLMDPIGFGLENFDWMGRWRDQDSNGRPVDASGALPSGEKFSGPVELKKLMLARKDAFVRNLVEKMLSYALGRGLESYDIPAVRKIADAVARDGYRSQTLVREIVRSYPFRYRNNG
jgi:mono/diheme cytochrome c family protein